MYPNIAGQTGTTSQKQSLAIDKGNGQAPGIGVDAVGIQTAINVPDSKFGQVEFQKGDGTSAVGLNTVVIQTALAAPSKPVTVNAVDKTQVVRGNASGY